MNQQRRRENRGKSPKIGVFDRMYWIFFTLQLRIDTQLQ
jgi:hypothetical protein